jgi:hypothetical protein
MLCYAGFSKEAEKNRTNWINRILCVTTAGATWEETAKPFKPKFPKIPRMTNYKGKLPETFWAEFPVNLVTPGKPSINKKKLKTMGRHIGSVGSKQTRQSVRIHC